jgi:L-alanine-DL-glutamate epimerase-like enolase superfamily enzyme
VPSAEPGHMRLTLSETVMPLSHAFAIARGSRTHARTVISRLEHESIVGLGEASPVERYNESVESVRAWFAEHPIRAEDPFSIEELLAGVPRAARCALDLSIHDWIGKRFDVPLWRYLGLDPARAPSTSYTIGIADTGEMLAKLEAARGYDIIKVKLGLGRDIEIIEAMRSRYSGTLRIDANEGWTPEESVKLLNEMKRFDIELCEQPIPAGSPERLRWIRERISIPLVADEDAKDARDVALLKGCVDGVNVKLVKTGGIRGALEMIHAARALGLRIMLGCMLESSLLATAAAHVAPLVDWVDVDAPLLLAEDPFVGLTYNGGKMILPDGPGLGVVERAA